MVELCDKYSKDELCEIVAKSFEFAESLATEMAGENDFAIPDHLMTKLIEIMSYAK